MSVNETDPEVPCLNDCEEKAKSSSVYPPQYNDPADDEANPCQASLLANSVDYDTSSYNLNCQDSRFYSGRPPAYLETILALQHDSRLFECSSNNGRPADAPPAYDSVILFAGSSSNVSDKDTKGCPFIVCHIFQQLATERQIRRRRRNACIAFISVYLLMVFILVTFCFAKQYL